MPGWLDVYIQQCAPEVGFSTMAAIVKVESGGNPWAIGDNTTKSPVSPNPPNYYEAVSVANRLIAQRHSIDIGLAQLNSKNLRRLGLTVEQAFDPCTNLRAGSYILREHYSPAAAKYGTGTKALLHALSGYNTGSLYAGGDYVKRILAAAHNPQLYGIVAPAMAERRTYYQPGSPKTSSDKIIVLSQNDGKQQPTWLLK